MLKIHEKVPFLDQRKCGVGDALRRKQSKGCQGRANSANCGVMFVNHLKRSIVLPDYDQERGNLTRCDQTYLWIEEDDEKL
jgi:hypothetical protein